MTYFHGGVPGLRLGDELLPPSVTGRFGLLSASDIARDEFGATHVRKDRVFLGSSVEIATIFAAMYPADAGGWIYEVEPVGEVEPDPDYHGAPDESVQVGAAIIVRILGPLPADYVSRLRLALMAGAA